MSSFTINPTSGSGDGSITISPLSNNDTNYNIVEQITIKTDRGQEKTISITQYGKPIIYLETVSDFDASGGTVLVQYWGTYGGLNITSDIKVEGTYNNVNLTNIGTPNYSNNKMNAVLTLDENITGKLGFIRLTASFKGVTADKWIYQWTKNSIELPKFNLLKFTMESPCIPQERIPEGYLQYNNEENWKWEKIENTYDHYLLYHYVDGQWQKFIPEGDYIQNYAWMKQDNLYVLYHYLSLDNGTEYWSKQESDVSFFEIDVRNTNIQILNEKQLSGVSDRINGELIYSTCKQIVRKNYTKIYNTEGIEYTYDNITSGLDIYNLRQYMTESSYSSIQEIVINFNKIITDTIRSGQRAVFIYIISRWHSMRYNGTGDLFINYNLFTLESEDKGLIKENFSTPFLQEDESVKQLILVNNRLNVWMPYIFKSGSLLGEKTIIATIVYDLETQNIVFYPGEVTEEDLYSVPDTAGSFILE